MFLFKQLQSTWDICAHGIVQLKEILKMSRWLKFQMIKYENVPW